MFGIIRLLIGVSSSATEGVSREEYETVRIHPNHAFSILAVHCFRSPAASVNQSRYVLVRDPHASSGYSEKTLNKEKLETLRSVHHADRSSGAFWIGWSSFLRYFSSVTISRYSGDMHESRETGKFTRSAAENLLSYYFELTQ